MERNQTRNGDRGRGRDEPERSGSRDRADSGRSSGRSPRDDDRGSSSRRDSGRSSSRSSFAYRERDPGDAKKRSSSGANDFDKILKDHIKMWKPNDGDNRIRILPPTWDDAKHFGLDIYVHYGVGADRQTYLCLAKMKGSADPIAEERERARQDEDEKYAKELEAKRRVLVYLIDRDHEKEGVQAWAMPWTVDRDIVKVSVDKTNGEVLPIDHPDDGFDVEFEKKGAKDRTEYLGVAIARRSTPLGKDEWLDFAMDNPLPDQLNFFDYDHIAKVFGGHGERKESPRDRDDTQRDSRDRGDRNPPPERGRREVTRDETPDLTWESIHEMTGQELDDLVEQEKLDINPDEAKDDDDLADWICEEMKIKKQEPKASTRRNLASQDSSDDDRLAKMRARRRD